MARTKPRKKRLSADSLYPLISWLCLAFAIGNLFVVYLFERDRQPRIERHLETVTTNHLIVVTNYIESVSKPSSPSSASASSSPLPDIEILADYDYFMLDGFRYIRYCGRNYGEGAPVSYGRIVTIFPDRVLLDNGKYLKNVKFAFGVNGGTADVGIRDNQPVL